MINFIAILTVIGSFIWSFFDPIWSWVPLFCAGMLLFIMLVSIKIRNSEYIEELSPMANEMFRKYGHFYLMPYAVSSCSGACSTVQFGAVAVGVVDAFNGFWWGIGLALVFWLVLGPVSMAFNPTAFIRNNRPHLIAHMEVIDWIKASRQRAQRDSLDKQDEPSVPYESEKIREHTTGEDQKRTIVLVDADDGIQLLLEEEIKDEFGDIVKLIQFKRAALALEYMTSNKVDLVISCIVLPGINGIEFLKECKKNYPKIPFIIHTALREHTNKEELLPYDAYVVKTPILDTLKREIRKFIS